ncbi:hypothetical protein KDH_07660 [Dictyobacter sp. S3.2.2.5]|uniref:FAD-binding domain-containing protein n=1 Tax=Dictyobacter halimunensis TaxID=3026934 RepID=A0ABQ6FJV3_9CHLR|nr:hypothetical protein KDH_07660 [Dictyobacter sp. S3.2.2.5]
MSNAGEHAFQELEHSHKASPEQYDVAILGGGIAGLTVALQIKQMRPNTRILVLEKQEHPVPEAAHKVGESTVEVAAYYLRDVLGLDEHLQKQQLRKFGLRMFFSSGDNQEIERRVEYGQIEQAPLPAYQIDRGRLENALGDEIRRRDITFLDGCKVQRIELQPQDAFHRVRILHQESEREIEARWLIDASGRSALLKRQLGLAKKWSTTPMPSGFASIIPSTSTVGPPIPSGAPASTARSVRSPPIT